MRKEILLLSCLPDSPGPGRAGSQILSSSVPFSTLFKTNQIVPSKPSESPRSLQPAGSSRMLTCGSRASPFLSFAPPTPACHMQTFQPLQSADLSPSLEPTRGASACGRLCPRGGGRYTCHEISAARQRAEIFPELDPSSTSLPLLPSPFSAHSASFLLLGVGDFWLMSSPPCSPGTRAHARTHTHTHTHTHNFCLSSLCLC